MQPTINLCFGFISDIDPDTGRVKVEFREDTDEGGLEGGEDTTLVSDWIPISVRKSLKDKETFPYDVNEHVWCVMDEHLEYGICCGAIYNSEDTPNGAGGDIHRLYYKDGSYEQFDRSVGNKENFYKGVYKTSNQAGAIHQMNSRHSIKNGVESLFSLLSDLLDANMQMTFTNGGGTTAISNNLPTFVALKTRLATLLE